jgi:hypothetical protein
LACNCVQVAFRHDQFFIREPGTGHTVPADRGEIDRRFGPHVAEAVIAMPHVWINFEDDPRAEAAACPFAPGDWVNVSDPTGSYTSAVGRFVRVEPDGQYCVSVDRGRVAMGGRHHADYREETYPADRLARWENPSARIAKHNIAAVAAVVDLLA